MSDANRPHSKRGIVRAALALLAAGAVFAAAVDGHAQRGFGMGRGMGDGMRAPGGIGQHYPGGDGQRHPGRPGGVVVVPGGGYTPIGPGTVIVDDDGSAPKKMRRVKKTAAKQKPKVQKQLAQRGGFDAPPAGETRFVRNEVLLNIASGLSAPALDAIARRHRLTRLETHDFTLTRHRIARLRINDGRPVATVIRGLQSEARVLGAQPNYRYLLQQGTTPAASCVDSPQYALAKLHLPQAQALVKGEGVLVAIVDTMIDAAHPDLAGTIAASFDATGAPDKPHAHGTGIAGLIAAHGKLVGAAPAVKLLAVHAFSSAGFDGSSMSVLKGLEWAGVGKANIVNMSFAGPGDSEMHDMIMALRGKGAVLIAAAGNAGPKSRPLYPAAFPEVIAVTATDENDRLFELSNRGTHIAVAAPGVAILAPAPNESVQMQSGTSFAAAQVSGIAALILERNRKLDAGAIRRILMSTAHDLGVPGHDDQFGSGLADAYAAVMSATPKASDASSNAPAGN